VIFFFSLRRLFITAEIFERLQREKSKEEEEEKWLVFPGLL
jgi:hypothetical protein